MSRVYDILVRARDALSDHREERWSDDRLIRLIDDGQKDIAAHTRILKDTYKFYLQDDIHTYPLPENVYLITRVSHNGEFLPLVSYDKMDKDYTDWELTKAPRIHAMVYDRRNMHELRVYPIPEDAAPEDDPYEFENGDIPEFVGDEVFGVVTNIDNYTLNTVLGVVTDVFDPGIEEEYFSDIWGVVTHMSESDANVTVWYIRIPDTVTKDTDELEIPPMFDRALRYFVIANAYADDLDTANQQKSSAAYAQYERELRLIKSADTMDGMRTPKNTEASYRGAFDE